MGQFLAIIQDIKIKIKMKFLIPLLVVLATSDAFFLGFGRNPDARDVDIKDTDTEELARLLGEILVKELRNNNYNNHHDDDHDDDDDDDHDNDDDDDDDDDDNHHNSYNNHHNNDNDHNDDDDDNNHRNYNNNHNNRNKNKKHHKK